MVAWPCCFAPEVAQYTKVGVHGRGDMFTSQQPGGSRERERDRKEPRPRGPLKGMLQLGNVLQLGPTS